MGGNGGHRSKNTRKRRKTPSKYAGKLLNAEVKEKLSKINEKIVNGLRPTQDELTLTRRELVIKQFKNRKLADIETFDQKPKHSSLDDFTEGLNTSYDLWGGENDQKSASNSSKSATKLEIKNLSSFNPSQKDFDEGLRKAVGKESRTQVVEVENTPYRQILKAMPKPDEMLEDDDQEDEISEVSESEEEEIVVDGVSNRTTKPKSKYKRNRDRRNRIKEGERKEKLKQTKRDRQLGNVKAVLTNFKRENKEKAAIKEKIVIERSEIRQQKQLEESETIDVALEIKSQKLRHLEPHGNLVKECMQRFERNNMVESTTHLNHNKQSKRQKLRQKTVTKFK